MYWRRFAISSIPLSDPAKFDVWLNRQWEEKDRLLESFIETGRFPAADAATDSQTPGYIETEVRLKSWFEISQIFVVVAALALVLNVLVKVARIVVAPFARFKSGA